MRARFVLLGVAIAAASGCPAPTPPQPSIVPSTAPTPIASPSLRPSPSPTPRPSPSWDPNVQRPYSFGGKRELAVVGPFRLVAGDRQFHCTFEGRGTITVYLIRNDGEKDAELFNRTGTFSETVQHAVATSADYYLQVSGADGAWRIDVN